MGLKGSVLLPDGVGVEKRTAPHIYCGDLSFLEWEGDKPITVRWQLKSLVDDRCEIVVLQYLRCSSGESGSLDI